jgi:hypothetical protein
MEPWKLHELEPFRAEFLAGLKTERYAVGLKDGLGIAKKLMEPTIISLIQQDIGGDHQQITEKRTRYLAVTFKYCLLPVWVANYRYQDKLFQILINGRTGKVSGERPWSFWKIFRLVALIVLAIGAIVALVMSMQKAGGATPPAHPPRSGRVARRLRRRAVTSRRQAVASPGVVGPAGEADAVVEPAGPPLPELEDGRQHAVAAPVGRPGHVPVGVLRHQLGVPGFEQGAIGDDRTLGRCPRPEPTTQRPVHEVGVRFRRGHLLDHALDAHLSFEGVPEEHERDARVGRHLAALAAVVVGEEREPAVVEHLQEHGAGRRAAVGRAGGQGEGVRLG